MLGKISSEINNPGKYSRSIFTDCKTPISASVIYENKFKSVNLFSTKHWLINQILNLKKQRIKVSFENDEDDKNLLILSIYLKNNSFLDAYENLLEKIILLSIIDDQNYVLILFQIY